MAYNSQREWCTEQTQKLLNEDLRVSTLHEIQTYISTLSSDEASEIAKQFQLPIVFDCLNASKNEQIDLACEVLSLCMSNLSIGETANKYGSSIERSLYHPSANVKLMALREVFRTASHDEYLSVLLKQPSLIVALVACVADDNLEVAKQASDILTIIGTNKNGLKQMLSPDTQQAIVEIIAKSDVIRFRIYEIIIDICIHSEESLNILLSTGLITSLLSELDNNDILLKLNAVELLTKLCACDHGLHYLQSHGIIWNIIGNLPRLNDDPMAVLVLPGFLKFFGNVAHWIPTQVFEKHPETFNFLLNIINEGNFSLLPVAYDTLGYIASTSDGKFILNSIADQKMTATIKSIGSQLISLPAELSIRALNCIENLIRLPPQLQNQNYQRVSTITQQWFTVLHSDPMSLINKYTHNPFGDQRCAGLNILQAIAEHEWGAQIINNTPGCLEFLLDRRVETTKAAKEIKYEIVKSLTESGAGIVSEHTMSRLQQFVKQGPFYVQTETEVAIESNS